MKSIFISLSSILILVYFGFGLLLYLRQNSFIYYPTPEQSHDGVESRSFSINGETINTFIVNPGQKKAVLYFGGNSEEVGFNAPIFGPALPDSTIYLTNYRGYGGSSGEPSEQVLFADALTLYDELKAQYSSLSIIGRSLGSGVAAHLATHREIDRLVLVTPYDSIENLAQDQYPFYPISLILRDKYKTIDLVDKIKAQTLIFIAEYDQLIAPKHSLKLASAFPNQQVQVETIPNVEHGNITGHPHYQARLRDFFSPKFK